MAKYNFINNELIEAGYNHAWRLSSKEFDKAVRLIIFEKERIIYIRINDFSWNFGFHEKYILLWTNKRFNSCACHLWYHFICDWIFHYSCFVIRTSKLYNERSGHPMLFEKIRILQGLGKASTLQEMASNIF